MSDTPQVPSDLTAPAAQPAPPPADLPDAAPAAERKRSKRAPKGKAKTSEKTVKGAAKGKQARSSKEKGSKRARRNERRAVPDEGFDFLGGKFAAAVRTRVMNLVLIAVLVLIGGTFIARAVTAGVATAGDGAAAEEARQRNNVIQLDLQQRTAAGTATRGDVDDHIGARSKIIKTATERELDLPMIFASVNGLAPGARITSIAIGGEKSETPPSGEEDTASSGSNDNKITLRGSIALETQAQGLNAALQNLDWAEGGAATLSCGAAPTGSRNNNESSAPGAACTWDWTGTLTETAYSTRSVDLPRIVQRPGSPNTQGGN